MGLGGVALKNQLIISKTSSVLSQQQTFNSESVLVLKLWKEKPFLMEETWYEFRIMVIVLIMY